MASDTQSPPGGIAPDGAAPDDAASGGAASAPASFKVELDLEDAPFLDEKAESAPPEKKPSAQEKAAADKPAPAKEKKASALAGRLSALLANKKRLALVGGVALFLLLAPLGLLFFLSGGKKAPTPAVPDPEIITQPAAPPRQDAPPGPKFLFKAETFMVALKGSEGQIRFLHCRFSIPTENQTLYAELMAKNVAVRDAIYYYLSNKPLTFLVDATAHDALKQDMISVVNEHVSAEKILDLYIEDYYVSGK
jgi:flagellar FliL protein